MGVAPDHVPGEAWRREPTSGTPETLGGVVLANGAGSPTTTSDGLLVDSRLPKLKDVLEGVDGTRSTTACHWTAAVTSIVIQPTAKLPDRATGVVEGTPGAFCEVSVDSSHWSVGRERTSAPFVDSLFA